MQYRNAAKDVYRRGDTLRKKIFVWRRVFLYRRLQTDGICQHQAGMMPIDPPYHLGWAVIRHHR